MAKPIVVLAAPLADGFLDTVGLLSGDHILCDEVREISLRVAGARSVASSSVATSGSWVS